jgi:signal transduction histidine kinase
MSRAGLLSKLLPGFWQRIFLATLVMILISHAIYAFIVALNIRQPKNWRQLRTDYLVAKIKKPLTGKSLSEAGIFLDYLNGFGPQLWFESPEGEVLAGEAIEGLKASDRLETGPRLVMEDGEEIYQALADWETGPKSPLELMVTWVDLREGRTRMCYAYWNNDVPYYSRNFSLGLAVLVLIALFLSYLVARILARPLDRLRGEVLAIDESRLDLRVSTEGPKEVSDVASSINALTVSLERHIRQMKELSANISHELRSPLARLDFAFTFLERGLNWARWQIGEAVSRGYVLGQPPEAVMEEGPWPLAVSQKGLEGSDWPGGREKGDGSFERSGPLALARKYLGIYREEVLLMDALIGSILISSKIELGYKDLCLDLVDLSQLASELCYKFAPIYASEKLGFSYDIEENICSAINKYLFQSILINLFDNALKYASERGSVFFALERTQEGADDKSCQGINLTIKNKCDNIDENSLEKIFDPFFRMNNDNATGSGLGLHLVKKITEMHKGVIKADKAGQYLTISINLPLEGE